MEQISSMRAPAPWRLKGQGYITLFRYSSGMSDEQAFVPKALQGKRAGSPWALMMFVDYAQSPVGPYHELLFIPGAYRFPNGRRYRSISKIYVSSMDSVINGQRNWGIPKELAQFDVRYAQDGLDQIRVLQQEHCFASLNYRSWRLPIPVLGGLVPAAMRTLAQVCDEQGYIYSPAANGLAQPARLVSAEFDPAFFPALNTRQAALTVKLPHFNMVFPDSRRFPMVDVANCEVAA